MSLTYVGSRPTHYQYGDLVEANVETAISASDKPWNPKRAYAAGETVQGVVLEAELRSARMLDQGRVQIEVDNGDRLWVQAVRVISTRAAREHPLASVWEVSRFEWTCSCGRKGIAATEIDARQQHEHHGHWA